MFCRAIQHDRIVSVIGASIDNVRFNQHVVSSVVIVMERCDTDLEKLIKNPELHPMLKGTVPARTRTPLFFVFVFLAPSHCA